MNTQTQISTNTEPRMWCSVIRGLLLPLQEHNIETGKLLRACKISESELQDPLGEVPLRTYLKFFQSAVEVADDPLLPIRLARSVGPETLGALGFLFLSSQTLSEGLNNLCHYMNVLQDTTYAQFRQDSREITFSYQLYHLNDTDSRPDVEYSLAHICRLIRMYAGSAVTINALNFRHGPLAPVRDYSYLLKTDVYFDQDENSVTFPASFGQIKSNSYDPSLSGILKHFLDKEREQKSRIQTFSEQVSHAIVEANLTPPVTVATVASYLGVSEPTLYRRLKAEGTTFHKILSRMTFEVARNYLAESSLSITQIAFTLGFSASSNFTRAYTRWSGGQTPSEYRAEARATKEAGSLRASS